MRHRPDYRFHLTTHAHPDIPVVMVRASWADHPDVHGLGINLDLNAEQADQLAADLIAAASEIRSRCSVIAPDQAVS